jgi:hypothetical protein
MATGLSLTLIMRYVETECLARTIDIAPGQCRLLQLKFSKADELTTTDTILNRSCTWSFGSAAIGKARAKNGGVALEGPENVDARHI